MARRVIQFPVRNAFAPQRSHDSLARDTQEQTHRIAQQVEDELARRAERLATGRGADFEKARTYGVVTMKPLSRLARLRKLLATKLAKFLKRD